MWMGTTAIARLAVALAAFLGLAGAANAACRSEIYEDAHYTVCSFDPATADIRMFWETENEGPFRTFPALADALAADGLTLAFAINGGMYDTDFSPIGLYVEDGIEQVPANTRTVKARL